MAMVHGRGTLCGESITGDAAGWGGLTSDASESWFPFVIREELSNGSIPSGLSKE